MPDIGLSLVGLDLAFNITWNNAWMPSARDAFFLDFKRVIQHDIAASWAHLTFVHSSRSYHQEGED